MVKHKGVSIKTILLDEIDHLIAGDPTFKYASKSEFIHIAIRDKLKEHHEGKFKSQD